MSLKEITVGTIFPENKEIISLLPNTPASDSLKTLIHNRIHSAPVFDKESKKYNGFVDLLDLVALVDKIFKQTETSHDIFEEKIEEQKRLFEKETALSLVDLSKKNPFFPITKETSILQVLELMGNKGIKRLPVIENDIVVNILTQSMLVEWLDGNQQFYEADKTIKEFKNVGTYPVVGVETSKKAIEAFSLMAEHGVSAVALIDEDETLFSNLSAKDLKAMDGIMSFHTLYKTTLEFASLSRSKELKAFSTAITCHEDDTLARIMAKLSATRIHRLYVVDSFRKPLCVLALSDLLKIIFQQNS